MMRTVLIVDDDRVNARMMKRLLERSGVETVDAVSSGGAAEARLLTGSYDAMFLDLLMPDKDGMHLFCRLREGAYGEEIKDIPVFVISAVCSYFEEELKSLTPKKVWCKPVDPGEITTACTSTT